MLKRPKGWKFGNKLVGPYRILNLVGVVYRIVSKGEKEMIVHHDQLKHSYIPSQEGEPLCPSREVGELKVVDLTPPHDGIDHIASSCSACQT